MGLLFAFFASQAVIYLLQGHQFSARHKTKSKITLFRELKKSLNPNGIFINADQVLGNTEEIENLYHSMWLSEVKKNGITETELSEALDRMKEDNMASL